MAGMGFDVNRWIAYAKARVTSAVGKSNEELDRLEAERDVELADKPWLASDGEAPSFDEAKARIEWEADHQARVAAERKDPAAPTAAAPSPSVEPGSSSSATSGAAPSDTDPLASPEERSAAANARIELEARQKEAAARLDAIRQELGVDEPGPPPA